MACAGAGPRPRRTAGRGPGKDPGEGGIGDDNAQEKAQEERLSQGRVKNDGVHVISRYRQKVQQDGRVAEQDPVHMEPNQSLPANSVPRFSTSRTPSVRTRAWRAPGSQREQNTEREANQQERRQARDRQEQSDGMQRPDCQPDEPGDEHQQQRGPRRRTSIAAPSPGRPRRVPAACRATRPRSLPRASLVTPVADSTATATSADDVKHNGIVG